MEPELIHHIEENIGFHPKCSEKSLEIFKHGMAWSDLNVSEMTMVVGNALKGNKEIRETG